MSREKLHIVRTENLELEREREELERRRSELLTEDLEIRTVAVRSEKEKDAHLEEPDTAESRKLLDAYHSTLALFNKRIESIAMELEQIDTKLAKIYETLNLPKK